MGYLSCNAESAIATCDPHHWHLHTPNKLLQIREFPFAELVAATNAFSPDSFLGKGSHGSVYKATLHGGKLVAVKKTKLLRHNSSTSRHRSAACTGCGNCTSPAENEIEILSRVASPRRIVNLIGFCTDPNGTKLIVVEFMPNGSLHDLLHSPARPPGWTARVRLALQVAKAVQELHTSNPPVIHRDIKSSNVLIDGRWNARLGDFGLALRGHVEDVRVKCTPPAGTLGYLDPCYLAPEDLSAKSDVFSFGILLLEILSGRKAIDVNYSPPSVVDWAVPLIRRGEYAAICDRRIGAPSDSAVIRLLAVLAARCVRSTAGKRPWMAEVVECLKVVRKRIYSSPIWRGLKRRVARVEKEKALVEWEREARDYERSEEVVRAVKGGSGSRRNRRKVSSVTGVDNECGPSNEEVVVRSKSIGVASDSGGRRKGRVLFMGGTRLKKSHSMGVLQAPHHLWVQHYGDDEINNNHHHNNNNNNNNHDSIQSLETAMSQWVITDRLENKLLEKPLVHSLGESE